MKTFELKGTKRAALGKKATKADRAAGNIPCVLYGNGQNIDFTVTTEDVRKLVYTPETYLVNLDIDGEQHLAVVQETQWAPVKELLFHIDFLAVTADKPVQVSLPVYLTGHAAGVKAGGKLVQNARKLKVKGLYTNIPENITVDVTTLGLGKRYQVEDIKIENLQMMNPKDMLVAQVRATRNSGAAAAAAATEE
ncbi:MAG: 50S ribosomal protein L25/general stress protein Ctc [Paludibacteraceae bacterium]|nr:50S ribosomal protein L25/general stress protein Ctc [Paludibacteraceae bacterium]